MAWTVPPGEREQFDTREGQLIVKRSGLLTVGETSMIHPELAKRDVIERKVTNWDPTLYQVDTLEADSEDGIRVPVEVIRRKDARVDGTEPLWVFGYGGFKYSQFLSFQAIVAAWVESGGIYAVVHARGGNELGREWNEAAVRTRHFRSVVDFESAVRALHQARYGTPHTTMIHGRSHGGLVVARAALGWPELATLVLAEVPLADMLRFADKGRGGVTEYGDPEDSGEFASLLHLSSYHAVQERTRYPAFFVLPRGAPALVVGRGLWALTAERCGGRVEVGGRMRELPPPDRRGVGSSEEVPIPLCPVPSTDVQGVGVAGFDPGHTRGEPLRKGCFARLRPGPAVLRV